MMTGDIRSIGPVNAFCSDCCYANDITIYVYLHVVRLMADQISTFMVMTPK